MLRPDRQNSAVNRLRRSPGCTANSLTPQEIFRYPDSVGAPAKQNVLVERQIPSSSAPIGRGRTHDGPAWESVCEKRQHTEPKTAGIVGSRTARPTRRDAAVCRRNRVPTQEHVIIDRAGSVVKQAVDELPTSNAGTGRPCIDRGGTGADVRSASPDPSSNPPTHHQVSRLRAARAGTSVNRERSIDRC